MLWTMLAVTLAAGLAGWAAGWPEVLAGVAAPVVTTAGSWMLMTRTWASAPATLLPVMIRAFVAKSGLYLAYVTIVLKGTNARPEPFVAGLVGAFLVLHFTQAWALKRLMDGKQGN